LCHYTHKLKKTNYAIEQIPQIIEMTVIHVNKIAVRIRYIQLNSKNVARLHTQSKI